MANMKNTVMHERNIQTVSAKQSLAQPLVKAGVYAFLMVMALIVLFPFYWMIISSLKSLSEYKLNVPTLWPNVLDLEDSLEKDFAENILPLPCDQRYDAEDMEMIIKQLR